MVACLYLLVVARFHTRLMRRRCRILDARPIDVNDCPDNEYPDMVTLAEAIMVLDILDDESLAESKHKCELTAN